METFQSSFVSSLLQDLLERFNSVIFNEAGQVVQFDGEKELEILVRKLSTAQVLVNSSQVKTNKNWQHWVGDNVTRVCYDVEDLVDDVVLDASKTYSLLDKFLSFFSRGSTARKIQELHDLLDEIIKELDIVNRNNQQAPQGCGYLKEVVVAEPQLPFPDKLFGRDDDKDKIITMLLQETVSLVSIVGMNGIGKTTLAWCVLHDSAIRDNFHHIVWVPVSAGFDLKKITHFILHTRQECECEREREREHSNPCEKINDVLQNRYMGKNILIVMDDLWDVKHKDWTSFLSLFLKSTSCKVLLTTSNMNVAMVTNATQYQLPFLKDEECRGIIMDRATSFNNISERQRVSLEDVAGVMAQKCKGLPLAANILGLLLSSKESDDDRITLSQRDICDLREFKEEIFPTFRLNNPDLASHLKKCLAYCSLFPHGFNFNKDELVQLWMAEGFLQSQETRCVEQIGYEYFDELLCRSVFHVSHLHDQEVSTYKMHEFIHKFAEFIASYTCNRLDKDELSSSIRWFKKSRHLSLLCDSIRPCFFKEIEKCDGLRTLILLGENGTQVGQVPYSLFQKLERLRVLNLSHSNIFELPESLGRLKHLRYLNASHTPIQWLPKSASELHVLQVLKLRDCSDLLELPKNLKNLTNLIHLDVDLKGLRCMPQSIGSLSCLKTLPAFIVGKKDGYRITELKNLKHLCGAISLIDLDNVRDGADAREAMICDKPSVKSLELEWNRCSRHESKAMDILSAFQPHKNLKELYVTNYGGSDFPAWFTSPSCMLVNIHVRNCQQDGVLPSLGKLPFLVNLHIEGMHRVKYVDHRFCGEGSHVAFRSLESLKIQDMMCLKGWNNFPECSMPQLQTLIVEDCPNLCSMQSLNHMSSLQTFEINRCPGLKSLPGLPSSLQKLIIIESDMVKQQCQPEGSPQWGIINEIPDVEIDYETVATRSSS